MPKATVTVRELRNKDSGVDLSVTAYRELPGLVRSSFEYQVVVVTSLACFKLPSHKESDVVQFTLFKKFAEFEDLRARLNQAFSGTAFPPVVKKALIVNDAVIRERRNALDTFLKFISATPRVVTAPQVLTFLGVEVQKAKRFASGDIGNGTSDKQGGKEEEEETEEESGEKSKGSLFDDNEDEEAEESEDFLTTADSSNFDTDDFFSASDSKEASPYARMFEGQDLKPDLTEDDERDFSFVPGGIIVKPEPGGEATEHDAEEETEEESLHVDEDINLEKLLNLEDSSSKQQQEEQQPSSPPASPDQAKPTPTAKPRISQKPSVPTKPKPSPPTKPNLAPKPATPKPVIASKPVLNSPGAAKQDSSKGSKPAISNRPEPAPRKVKAERASSGGEISSGENMDSNDIMKYIAANADEDDDDDLGLFS